MNDNDSRSSFATIPPNTTTISVSDPCPSLVGAVVKVYFGSLDGSLED